MTVLEYIMTDEKVKQNGCTEETVKEMLTSMGFGVSKLLLPLMLVYRLFLEVGE